MYLSQFLAIVQLLILVAMVPVVMMAKRTSRRRRSRQKTFFSMAVMLTGLSLLGLLWILLATSEAVSGEDLAYWIAMLIPGAVLPLCVWTIWRTLDKRPLKAQASRARYNGQSRL